MIQKTMIIKAVLQELRENEQLREELKSILGIKDEND